MRTTLKRGVGRGANLANGKNGNAVFPPTAVSSVSRYKQPPRKRSGLGLIGKILLVALLTIVAIAIAAAGAGYLWYHDAVSHLRAHTQAMKIAQKETTETLPGHPAIGLVIGYDARSYGVDASSVSRSDTVMLIRADPATKTITLLSIPRDLGVNVYCPKQASTARLPEDQPGLCRLWPRRHRRHRRASDRLADQLRDQDQLPRLHPDGRQARGHLAQHRSPLLPREQWIRGRGLLEHQHRARLPAARRLDCAQLRSLPPHRRRLSPDRAPAGIHPGVQGRARAEGEPRRASRHSSRRSRRTSRSPET